MLKGEKHCENNHVRVYMSCVSKRLPNPWQEVILVRDGVAMIKFNSTLVYFSDIFGISISGINRNANTLVRYLKKYLDTTKY